MLDFFAAARPDPGSNPRPDATPTVNAGPSLLLAPPLLMNDTVLLTRDGPVATLTLNRPDALNALDYAMVEGLAACTAEVAADASLRVVVLRGAGKHFMAGGDIRTFAGELEHPPAVRQAGFQRLVERTHVAIEHLHRMPHPVVGRVHGAVAGFGLSLMNACDLVVAGDDTYFASAYRHIALTPDGGGSWSLPRLAGLRRAMEILLLSERFDAAEALRLGIVNRVVPAAGLDAATDAIVKSLVAAPVLALRNAKRLVRDSLGRTLSEQLQAEAVSFGQCAATADFAEGITAFLEKRPPRFGQD
ncbi:MAG: enoyl-CoA hydratase [Betaproteobacteria bacterium]